MRAWLTALTVGLLVLLALGLLAYTDLSRRMGQLERQLAEGPSVGRPSPPASETRQREVSVYFARLQDQELQLVPVSRRVPAEAPAEAALRELLKGPTPEERARGLHTEIPPGTRLEGLTIENGTAGAKFSPELDRGVAGSARVTTIRRQIEQTLRQFPEVKEVVIEVDGRVEDVLQP